MNQSGKFGSILASINEVSVSDAARRESRNREKHLPPLSTFRWWARRTGAVNDAIIEAAEQHFGARRLRIVDPFAGGGTIPLVARRRGHEVYAQDLNPWAAAGIQQMLELPLPESLAQARDDLQALVKPLLTAAYATVMSDGCDGFLIHTYRVAVGCCSNCGASQRQFPYSLLTLKYRKERGRPEAFLACRAGHVFEGDVDSAPCCPECGRTVDPYEILTPRRRVTCTSCGHSESLSQRDPQSWSWEPVLVERTDGKRREFDFPTASEFRQAEEGWKPSLKLGAIPPGSETSVLLRHGFRDWSDLFPLRQRVVMETLLDLCPKTSSDDNVVAALRMAIVGTAEFAGHLSRWDRFYLKCNDATAGHRFNFSTFVPEINVWGHNSLGRGTFSRRILAMSNASRWLGLEIPRASQEYATSDPLLTVRCGDSAQMKDAADSSFDLVLTDPPYHDDVHYGELSLLFRSWAGMSVEELDGEASTNHVKGINTSQEEYSASLVRIFEECNRVLQESGRLIFSYANLNLGAWRSLFHALSIAGFTSVSCVSVHSENETDFKKRGVDSCIEDLIMEFSPGSYADDPIVIGSVAENDAMQDILTLFRGVGRSASVLFR